MWLAFKKSTVSIPNIRVLSIGIWHRHLYYVLRVKGVGKRCHFWSQLTFSGYSTGESSMIIDSSREDRVKNFSVLDRVTIASNQFLRRVISGKFPGNFHDTHPNPIPHLPPTPPPHPPDFKWVFLDSWIVIKSDIFYLLPSCMYVCMYVSLCTYCTVAHA